MVPLIELLLEDAAQADAFVAALPQEWGWRMVFWIGLLPALLVSAAGCDRLPLASGKSSATASHGRTTG